MSSRTKSPVRGTPDPETAEAGIDPVNEVRLVGRLSGEPEEREMPSGDTLRSFRLVVEREAGAAPRSRQRHDTLDCVVWGGRVKRSVGTWRSGDVVEVTGAIRRRFYRAGAGPVSRVDVEVTGGKVIRRAAT
jgi:single-strand DNA-binding protein